MKTLKYNYNYTVKVKQCLGFLCIAILAAFCASCSTKTTTTGNYYCNNPYNQCSYTNSYYYGYRYYYPYQYSASSSTAYPNYYGYKQCYNYPYYYCSYYPRQ